MGNIDYQAFLRMYLSPDEAYAPVPFWFLNDELDDREITRQLTDFKAHGIHCVVLHPRIGIPRACPYLSDTFMRGIKAAVLCARDLSMRVILYDEGMYPSGSACGLVARENPLFSARCVYPDYDNGPLPENETQLCSGIINGRQARIVHAPSKGTIRGIHFGQDSREPDAPPAGDILNPDAVDCFIRLTHERYRDYVGGFFGKTVIGFFTDEPSPMGRYPRSGAFAWTWDMPDYFPVDMLPLLWQEGGEGDEARDMHHSAVSKRLGHVFYGRLSAWCRKNGLLLMGHPSEPDEILPQKYMDIPGQDLISRMIAPENDPLACKAGVMGKLTSDIARHNHKTRNLNEALGVCYRGSNTWDLPFADAKWMLDHLLSRGCNMLVLHAFFYSLRGARSGERPPDVGPNSPWWDGYTRFALYLSRLCQLNTGEYGAKIAVLCQDQMVPVALVRPLYEQQIDFVYLDEDAFLASDAHYPLVLYDEKYIFRQETYARLSQCRALTAFPMERPASPLRVQRMIKFGVSYMMVFNEGCCHASLDTTGYSQIWLPFEERRMLLAGTAAVLAPGQTAVLVSGPNEDLPVYGEEAHRKKIMWDNAWQAENSHGSLTLCLSDVASYRFCAPDIKYTDYSTCFVLPAFSRVFLSLQVIRECAYVFLNGLDACAFLLPDEEMDVTAYMREGVNTLCIRVMATPANLYNRACIPCGLAAVPTLSYSE